MSSLGVEKTTYILASVRWDVPAWVGGARRKGETVELHPSQLTSDQDSIHIGTRFLVRTKGYMG